MFFDAPLCLIQAILDGVAITAEPLKLRGIEAEESGVLCCLDDQ